MSKKKEIGESLQDFIEVKRFQEQLVDKARNKKLTMSLLFTVVYSVVAFLIFSSSSFIDLGSTSGAEQKYITEQIAKLQNNNDTLRALFEKAFATSTRPTALELKVLQLEENQKNLTDSLLLNSEDIITARLLTEKLNLQNEKIDSLQDDIRGLDDSYSKVMWSIIILPLLGFFGLLFKDKFFKREDPLV